jgi:uncharacterized YigZ family protein
MSFKTPLDTSHTEVEIKKSRFIGFAKKALTRREAMDFINELKKSYPDARHVCWGYLIGDPKNSTNSGCNDDGEPSGTAGKPILSQINYSNIGNIVVVIVRYFGGIRLGAGGLVRAYRESAQKTLKALVVEEHIPRVEISLTFPFKEENNLRKIVASLQGKILEVLYSSKVKSTVSLPKDSLSKLQQEINNTPIEIIEAT